METDKNKPKAERSIEVLIGKRSIGLASNIKGVEASYKTQTGVINRAVYEMKIPLTVSDDMKFAVNFFPNKKVKNIGIALESFEKMNMDMPDNEGFKKNDGNFKNGTMGNGGGPGGNSPSMLNRKQEMQESNMPAKNYSLKMSGTIVLAKNSDNHLFN